MDKYAKLNVSAVFVTFNEDRVLEKSLDSVSWVDEIVVFDMGSTDNTVKIAKKYGATVFEVAKVDFVELIRGEAIRAAKHDWICCMDPDFVFPVESVEKIFSLLQGDNSITCVSVAYRNYFEDKPIRFGRWGGINRFPAIFNRQAMRINKTLHSNFSLEKGSAHPLSPKYKIKHYWVKDDQAFLEKHSRYIKNEGKRRFDAGYFPSFWRTASLVLQMVGHYVRGGFLDGLTGLKLLKHSIWYEHSSERELRKTVAEKTEGAVCPACGSKTVQAVHNLHDDRYGYPGTFLMLRCKDCGHHFLLQNFTESDISNMYSNFYPRSQFDVSKWKPYTFIKRSLKSWLRGDYSDAFRWVPDNVKVLDVGCGFGESVGYLASRGCDAEGIEADKNILRVGEAFGIKVQYGVFSPENYAADSYDYVVMHQVAEHLMDPKKILSGITRILKPGGKLIMSTPGLSSFTRKIFGQKWLHWHCPYHLQFYTKKSLSRLLNETGLRLIRKKNITSSEWLHYQWGHALCYPEVGNKSPYWFQNESRQLMGKKRFVLKAESGLHKLKINHLITRFLDALGLGDNVIWFLEKKA